MPPRRKASASADDDVILNIPPPATTIEGRNNQLIDLAFSLVERRFHDGTASAQETVHFLRLGAAEQRLKEEKLRHESLLLETRMKEMESRTSGEELLGRALAAFKGYSGQEPIEEEEDGYEELH